MNFLLSQELGNAIMAYLIKQPYADVSGLIEGLKSLPIANVMQPTQPVAPTDPVANATETSEADNTSVETAETEE